MNERILSPQLLKLVQEAGPGYSLADPKWVKKFAELIVRECMSLCTDVEEDVELADYVGGFRDGALMCREDIKKHFGVEE